MSRKINAINTDYAIKEILNGRTATDLSIELGINYSTFMTHLSKHGFVVPRRGGCEVVKLPVEQIVTMYQDGESENAISKHFGTSRNVIRNRLLKAGIVPRTQGESEKLKWAKMTDEARKNQVKSAHAATLGCTRSDSTKETLAKAREKLKYDYLIGHGEFEFIELLSNSGIDFVHQKAIKFYNVDFAIGNVAVELTADTGRYTAFNPKELKRAKNLLECGYRVIAVEFNKVASLINCFDEVISTINELSRLDTFASEYWVIRCASKDYTISRNDFGQFSSEPSPEEFFTKRSIIQL